MKTITGVLSVIALFLFPLILSCSDDNSVNDDNGVNAVYDLRPISRLEIVYPTPTTQNLSLRMRQKKLHGHVFVQPGLHTAPGVPGALTEDSFETKETYEYLSANLLHWSNATRQGAGGNIIARATQTLNDAGCPTRVIWVDSAGDFMSASDYTYDKTLYLETSRIEYRDDPTDNPDAGRFDETTNVWNEDGVLATHTSIGYDSNGIKDYEGKWRSTTLKNSLRGAGGSGYYEYKKEYYGGLLTYQEKVTFDADGYPQTYSIDNNGDGTYEETYHSEITKTGEGYLESVTWIEDGTDNKYEKQTFAYDEEGLLKTVKNYDAVEDEFVLNTIETNVWYKNPVNGPTGGINVMTETDEEGKILKPYETVDWTESQKIHHYYDSNGEEVRRTTDSLEKIRLN